MTELLSATVLQALLDEADEALLALDAGGRVLVANAAAPAFLGVDDPEIDGQRFEDVVPAAGRENLRALLALGGGTVETMLPRGRAELRLRRLDDGTTVVRMRMLPPRKQSAGDYPALRDFLLHLPYGVVAMGPADDVEFANPLARLLFKPHELQPGRSLPEPWPSVSLASLLERVRRTRVASTAQIVDAGPRLLRLLALPPRDEDHALLVIESVTRQAQRDRVYGEFVRNAAHQLRTPTAAISSAIEVLQSGAKEVPADRNRFLDHIERESRRLTRLTQALLVLARADAGVQAPRLEFVRLKPLLEDVAAGLVTELGTSIEISCDNTIAIFVERDLAEQALQAVVENAVRHCREGIVVVRAWDSQTGTVTVEIDDPGRGILPEHLEHIKEAFYRVAVGTEGFGLGLAIASRAVSVLGGTLGIESTPGEGTYVTIELPSAQVTNP